MPYSNPKQATAVFLQIKREKGLAAAKVWGRKHRGEIAGEMKGNKNASKKHKSRRGKGYVPRSKQDPSSSRQEPNF